MPAYLETSYDDIPVELQKGIVVIGCDPKCDVVLADSTVAPRHGAIVNLEESHVVCDLGSDSGIFVNGERIYGRQPIQTGDEIIMGDVGFVYRDRHYIPVEERKTVALRTISPRDLEVVEAAVEHAQTRENPLVIPGDAKLADQPSAAGDDTSKSKPAHKGGGKNDAPNQRRKKPPKPKPKPPQQRRGSRRKRNSDVGTRAHLRRQLLSGGRKKSSLSDLDKDASQHSHRQNRRLRRRRATESRQRTAARRRRKKDRTSPDRYESDADIFSQALQWERTADSVQIVDAKCSHCGFVFCHVNDGFADASLEYDIKCQRCGKKIKIKPENRLKVIEKRRWNGHVWESLIDGLDLISLIGVIGVVVIMVHFTMLAGKGFHKYGQVAGSTFVVFESAAAVDTSTIIAAGISTLVFGLAPFVILASTRVIAEDFTFPLMWSLIAGCILSPVIWKMMPGILFAKIGMVAYAVIGLGILLGLFKLCDTKGTGLTQAVVAAVFLLLLAVIFLFVACGVTMEKIAVTEIIGSQNLAVWAMVAAAGWLSAEILQIRYMRGVSVFLEQPMLTKALDECTMFLVVLGMTAIGTLLLLFLGGLKDTAADLAWLLAGFVATMNVVWFFQVTRFTRYAIR